jgi:hypothetical protein
MAIVGTDDAIPGRALAPVLRAGATGEDTTTEIEMTTDAEILAGLLRKEANTILEDIDTTYPRNQTLFTGQPSQLPPYYSSLLCSSSLITLVP